MPRDVSTIVATSELAIARQEFDSRASRVHSAQSAYQQARIAYLDAARELQNRRQRALRQLDVLNMLEVDAGLPVTRLDPAYTDPEPITVADYGSAGQ